MSGPSLITVYRSEESTIDLTVEWRDAARVLVADLSATVVRLIMREYPKTDEAVLEIVNNGAAVSGCTLIMVNDDTARLRIPSDFWTTHEATKYSIEVWLETSAPTVTRVGYVILEVAGSQI